MAVEHKAEDLLLVPVHRPKMNWLVSFLNSIALYPVPEAARILLVASNERDARYFKQALSFHPLTNNLLYLDAEAWIADAFQSSALVERLRKNTDRCVINLKKVAGLHWALENGFEYAVCVDSDTLAVAGLAHLHEVARDNYDASLYLGATIEGAANRELLGGIIQKSAELFAPEEQKSIAEFTDGHTLYTWFSDVPAYRAEDLRAFFAYMQTTHGSMASFLSALRWGTFDHMLYALFRVARGQARIFDYGKELGIAVIPESLSPRDLFQIGTETGYEVGWMSAAKAYEHPEAFRILPNLSLLMHFDRF
jgi:hypothetical protein